MWQGGGGEEGVGRQSLSLRSPRELIMGRIIGATIDVNLLTASWGGHGFFTGCLAIIYHVLKDHHSDKD